MKATAQSFQLIIQRLALNSCALQLGPSNLIVSPPDQTPKSDFWELHIFSLFHFWRTIFYLISISCLKWRDG